MFKFHKSAYDKTIFKEWKIILFQYLKKPKILGNYKKMVFKAWKIILYKWIFERNKKKNDIIFKVRDKYNKLRRNICSNGKR